MTAPVPLGRVERLIMSAVIFMIEKLLRLLIIFVPVKVALSSRFSKMRGLYK